MKKILFIITLCVVCATSYGQDIPYSNETNEEIPIKPTWDLLKHYSKYSKQDYWEVPSYIRDNYQDGSNLIGAGNAMVVIGSITCFVAGMVYATKNIETYKSAGITMAVGTSILSVSIPLYCFGSHLKRESNMMYQLYRDHKIHMINYH